MSPKLPPKGSNCNNDSSGRQPVRSGELRPGNIVWLPESAMQKSQMIRAFDHSHEVQSRNIDEVLPKEAYNHPVVVLEIMHLPPSRHSDGDDDYVIVSKVRTFSRNPDSIDDLPCWEGTKKANKLDWLPTPKLTSFGYKAKYEGTCRLQTRRRQSLWHSYLAIYPSTHPSRPDFQLLHLQKGKLNKPSYVGLGRIYVPISVLETYKQGRAATASDIDLTSQSLDILLREVGIKAPPQSSEGRGRGRGPGPGTVGCTRATTAAITPLSPSLPAVLSSTQASLSTPRSMPYRPQIVVPKDILGRESEPSPSRRGAATVVPLSSPSSLATRSFADIVLSSVPPHNTPTRPQISAREDTLITTSLQTFSSQPVPLPYTRANYGSIDDWSLPPPTTWNPRVRASRISRISNSISRVSFLDWLRIAWCLLILGLIVFHIPWAAIGSIFTNIGHFFTSIWSSCWGFVANSWHTFVAWLKSLLASTK